jgi:hypothetical protein
MSTGPDIPHTSAAGLMEHVAAPIDADAAAQPSNMAHAARSSSPASRRDSFSSAGSPFISDNFRHLRNLA